MDTEFEEFWKLYPRKVARKDAQRAWIKMTAPQKFAALQSLPIHIRYWELAGRTKEYTPYPASWLNGERWEDELEMPEAEDTWWETQAGIYRKALAEGISPKPGEGWHELKARILAKARAA